MATKMQIFISYYFDFGQNLKKKKNPKGYSNKSCQIVDFMILVKLLK